jgi:hypothetical protein
LYFSYQNIVPMRSRIILLLFVIFVAASQSTFSQHGNSSQFLFIDSLLAKDNYHVELLGFNKKVPVVQATGSVNVIRNDNVVTFSTTDDKLKFFDSLTIDLKNEMVVFRSDTLPFLDEVYMPASSLFGEWNGYTWLKTTSNTDQNEVIIIDKQTKKFTQVDLGKVQHTNKILLRINYKEIVQGRPKAQFNVACYLN